MKVDSGTQQMRRSMQTLEDGLEPRLTRGEYWLLNNVVVAPCPVSFLVHNEIKELFNNPGHRLSRQRLVETLCEMSNRGWIEGYRLEGRISLTVAEIERGLTERSTEEGTELGYQLTALGGAVWEAFAAPDWDRYLHVWTSAEGELNEYFSASRWRVEKYLSLVHHLGILIAPNSIVWDDVAPWGATYWKTLPHGHRVSFLHREIDEPRSWDKVPHEVMSLQRWYDWE
jgi:hypothetical protein